MVDRDERPAVEVEGLSKRFGRFLALDDVSFSIARGEVYGWLGPNGAGKTTTIRILLGLLKATGGRVQVLGLDPQRQRKKVHARVGYMSQQFTLYKDLTAAENIRFYGQAYGLSRRRLRQRQAELLAMAGLEKRAHVLTANLSGGWKQRLALGCAIVHRPQVLFLDEPTAGVDPVSRREFWRLIYRMAEEGVTVLVTTHYMDEAELCERVGFLSGGRLIALDTPERLKETKMQGQVLEVNTAAPEMAMRLLQQAQRQGKLQAAEIALYGAQIHIVVEDVDAGKAAVRRLLAGERVPLSTIEWIAPTLEDVFISAIRAAGAGNGGRESRTVR